MGLSKALDKVLTYKTRVFIIAPVLRVRHYRLTASCVNDFCGASIEQGRDVKQYVGSESDVC